LVEMVFYRSIFFCLFFSFLSTSLFSDTLKVKLVNGTSSTVGKAETVKLLSLSGSMEPIASKDNVNGEFEFTNVSLPAGSPILIQATYHKVNYNKIVPPVPKMRNAVQELIVYDSIDDKSLLEINSLLQIVREPKAYRVYKVFLIHNASKPPRTFFSETKPLEVFVPKTHAELYGQLRQETSNMGIPLGLPDGTHGKQVNRGIMPGRSEIQISYTIPIENEAAMFEDKQVLDAGGNFRAVFVKPKDIGVKVENAQSFSKLEKEIPDGLSAYRVAYSLSKPIQIFLSGGTPVSVTKTQPVNREITNGKIFTDVWKNILGVVTILAFLVSLSFIFVYRK
jgi:hypothetical protein